MGKGCRVKCLDCGDIVQSLSHNHRPMCTCYRKSGAKVERCAQLLMEQLLLDERDYHLVRCYINDEFGTGVTVDGGSDYLHMSYSRGKRYEILDEEE